MEDRTAESLAALTQLMVVDARFDQTLQRVTELAGQAVGPASMAGITMVVDGRAGTAFFTEEEVREIDQAQYDVGDGPCLESFRTGEPVIIESTLEDRRWPEFCRLAVEHGVYSTLSLPLVAGGDSLGALNLYAAEPSAFSDEDVQTASQFATQAGVVLANAQAYWDAREQAQGLALALVSREVIGQAKGILMAQSGIGPDEAFELLRQSASREERKLRDVAADIVRRFGGQQADVE
jgi:GAF domain-containing protein